MINTQDKLRIYLPIVGSRAPSVDQMIVSFLAVFFVIGVGKEPSLPTRNRKVKSRSDHQPTS